MLKIRLLAWAGAAVLSAGAGLVTVVPASSATGTEPGGASASAGLDPAALQSALDGVHRAGVPGVHAEVRDAGRAWRGASGAASLVSTMNDVNRFYAALLGGRIVGRSSLAQMQRTVPVVEFGGQKVDYGLGLARFTIPGCGTVWGNGGAVWGAGTMSMTSADGRRQLSVAMNLMHWNALDSSGKPQRHPIDTALPTLYQRAMCGNGTAR